MPEQPEKFESWAIVEIMGHKKLAGYVGEQTIAGSALVRVDVPATLDENGQPQSAAYTKLIGVSSIYAITPTTEDIARRAAQQIERWNEPLPVTLPSARQIGSGTIVDVEPVEGDDDDDDDEYIFTAMGPVLEALDILEYAREEAAENPAPYAIAACDDARKAVLEGITGVVQAARKESADDLAALRARAEAAERERDQWKPAAYGDVDV